MEQADYKPNVEGDDRAEEQIVALTCATDAVVPRRAVASADIDEIGHGVVVDGIPGRAAAARLPVDERQGRDGLLGEHRPHFEAVGAGDRLVAYRVFEDQAGKMNRSVREVGGSVLLDLLPRLAVPIRGPAAPGGSAKARCYTR